MFVNPRSYSYQISKNNNRLKFASINLFISVYVSNYLCVQVYLFGYLFVFLYTFINGQIRIKFQKTTNFSIRISKLIYFCSRVKLFESAGQYICLSICLFMYMFINPCSYSNETLVIRFAPNKTINSSISHQ